MIGNSKQILSVFTKLETANRLELLEIILQLNYSAAINRRYSS